MTAQAERERFIPVAKADLIADLAHSSLIGNDDQRDFHLFTRLLDSLFHFEFHAKTETLKKNYQPFDPDSDLIAVRTIGLEEKDNHEQALIEAFANILDKANYHEITQTDLDYAMQRESLFRINLFVDFQDFENQLIYCRGSRSRQICRNACFFKKQWVDITVYDRVALIIKFKDRAYFEARNRNHLTFEPGSMLVKLFKNIPKGDLEMLFPNAQVRMKLKDKLLMGGFALGGGITVFLKASAGLVAMAGVFWLMVRTFMARGGEIPSLGPSEVSGMVGGVTALAAIGAFLFKQWNSYKNRKIKFMKTLGDNLYFKNLDNNAGVFYHIVAEAEEEEFKEVLLSYLFLLQSEKGLTAKDLDNAIETWFSKTYRFSIDFEIEDALAKLKRLTLCSVEEMPSGQPPVFKAVSLWEACRRLDRQWDEFFQVEEP